jgi:hypothetical protein
LQFNLPSAIVEGILISSIPLKSTKTTMKNPKAGASLCLAILHCLVSALTQPAYAKRSINGPFLKPLWLHEKLEGLGADLWGEFLKPLRLHEKPEGLGADLWEEAQKHAARQPRPITIIDPMTWRMCKLQPNQRFRTCLAIREAAKYEELLNYSKEILKTRKDNPLESVGSFVLGFGAGAAGVKLAANVVGASLTGPIGIAVVGTGAVISGIAAHQHRKGNFEASIRDVEKEQERVSKILQGLVRNGVYLESLCLSYNGVVKISERGEMICYRKNTDSSKSANQFNLASLADAHGKVCQELYGKKAAPARYVLGNKIVCSVNNKYEVVKEYTLTDLINGCKMTGKKVGEATTKVCTDFIADMKKTKPNSTVIGQKTDATSPTEKADAKKTDATSPKATSTTGEQSIADQVAQIIGTDPAQKSQTGNPLSPDRTTESMKKLKHQMILEAIKRERESNKMMAENFEKLIKAKIEDARRDTEFHQKVHEFLLKKIEHDALEHQEKMIRHEQYIREQQEKIRSIQQLIHPGRFHSIKQQQHLGAQQ